MKVKNNFSFCIAAVLVFLISLGFASAWADDGNPTQNVDGCNIINTSNAVYTLIDNVSSAGNCFNITVENVTLDCDGHWINYSINGAADDYGIYTDKFNTTIRNCNVVDGNWTSFSTDRHGIFLEESNYSILLNNNINVNNSYAIYLDESNFNNLTSNLGKSNTSTGIILYSSSRNTLLNNNGTSLGGWYGIYLTISSDNNNLTSNIGEGNTGDGIRIDFSSNNNTLMYNNGTSNTYSGIYLYQSLNNILIKNTGTSINGNGGILIVSSSHNTSLINNTGISLGTGIAISISSSSNNNLTDNIGLSNTGTAISFSSSSNNTLTNNKGISNTSNGIYFSSGSNNTLRENNGTSFGAGAGLRISSSVNNTIISNSFRSSTNYGIFLQSSSHNNTLMNNNGTSTSDMGIYISSSSDNNFTYNNGTSLGNDYGFYLSSSSNNNLTDNIAISNTFYALYLSSSSNNTFIRQTATTFGATGTSRYAIYIYNSNNTLFRDCINISGGSRDISYLSSPSINNTFINCTYDASKEIVNGAGNELIRKWYYQAYVNNSLGDSIENANVTAYNSSGEIQFTENTNSSGLIQRKELIEYFNRAGTRYYYNNYTINATNTTITKTNIFNFTITQNKLNDVFTLSEELTPGEDACGILDSANTIYTLTQDVSSTGTCFNITAENITLDCDGHWINYSTSGSGGQNGVYTDQFNTTILNCNIVDGYPNPANVNRYGIYLRTADNSTIYNVLVNTSNSNSIYLYQSADFNNLTSITTITGSRTGIYLSSSSYNTFSNITTIAYTGIGTGIYVFSGTNNTFYDVNSTSYSYHTIELYLANNTFFSNLTATSYSFYSFYILDSNYNIFSDVTANSYGNSYGIELSGGFNNTFSNFQVNSDSYSGMKISSSSYNTFSNVTINSSEDDIHFFADSSYLKCDNNFTNVTGKDGKPVLYYHDAMGISVSDLDASTIIFCGVHYSNISNINATHGGIKVLHSDSNIISNINSTSRGESDYAVYIYESGYNNISNITSYSNGDDGGSFYLSSSDNNNISNVDSRYDGAGGSAFHTYTIMNNFFYNISAYATGDNTMGTYLDSYTGFSSFYNLNTTYFGELGAALYLFEGDYLNFINPKITASTVSGDSYGIFMYYTWNSVFTDSIDISGSTLDIYYDSTPVEGSYNNTFLNCSYDLSKELVEGTNNQLIRKWYYQSYVNNTYGNPVSDANITAYNTTGDIQFTEQTNASGWISKQEITEYINTEGIKTFYNNYTIFANKSDATLNGTNTFNFTITQNKIDDLFTLTIPDLTSPTYASVSHNSTYANYPTLFSINITDETALHPDGQYIFSTNNTGEWVNDSPVNFTETPSWANITKTLNSTIGTILSYRWYFNDSAGNEKSTSIYSLTTTEFPVYTPPSGGGGGSSYSNYNLNREFSQYGETFSLRRSDRVGFTHKGDSHTFTLDSFNSETAKITIQSNPITLYLDVDILEDVDLDNDSIDDIEILYDGISDSEAQIFIQKIVETTGDVVEETIFIGSGNIDNTAGIGDSSPYDVNNLEEGSANTKKREINALFVILLSFLTIFVILMILAMIGKKGKKKKEHYLSLFDKI